jgi:prepilin-type N-terminal cleavage/methylation domain-containing protein
MVSRLRAFTLIEVMIVILIVMVLAAITIPLMRARLDNGKWAEANMGAGMIRRAVKAYYAGTGDTVTGTLDDAEIQDALGIAPGDLSGTYFVPGDYQIMSVNKDGIAVIQVTGSQKNAPEGSKILTADGTWQDVSQQVPQRLLRRPPVSPIQ